MTDLLAQAKDLSKEEPRAMATKLDGYEWLPRLIDKARASVAGTLGDYYKYPCPIDRVCLDILGLTADEFSDISVRFADDAAILGELKRRGIPAAADAAFDPVAMNERLHGGGS